MTSPSSAAARPLRLLLHAFTCVGGGLAAYALVAVVWIAIGVGPMQVVAGALAATALAAAWRLRLYALALGVVPVVAFAAWLFTFVSNQPLLPD